MNVAGIDGEGTRVGWGVIARAEEGLMNCARGGAEGVRAR